MVDQRIDPKTKLDYEEHKTKFVAGMIARAKEMCNAQQFNLRKGLQEFKVEGEIACKQELSQMHLRIGFKALAVRELTRLERRRAQEGLMLLRRKKTGAVKG